MEVLCVYLFVHVISTVKRQEVYRTQDTTNLDVLTAIDTSWPCSFCGSTNPDLDALNYTVIFYELMHLACK